MAVSNKPSLLQIAAEFGAGSPIRFSDYIRGGPRVPSGNAQNANISTTASGLRLTQFAGSVKEFVITITGSQSFLNVRSSFNALYGSPTGAVIVRVLINPGAHVHYFNNTSPAINVGSFPAGSKIIIENRGQITGGRGAFNGGIGGNCINSIDGTITEIYNYGTIAPGGGGGGVGGTGGQGTYQTTGTTYLGDSGNQVAYQDCGQACRNVWGSTAYCTSGDPYTCFGVGWLSRCYACARTDTINNYTVGGTGGPGGTGYGVYDTSGTIANATTGFNGGTGGTNAGVGGTGGTGGGSGIVGNMGGNGSAGNYTSGSAGGTGGAGGSWLRHTTGKATLILNSGSIFGSSVAI